MSGELAGAIIGLAGVVLSLVVTQTLLHRRWSAEQDRKRDEIIETQQNQRREEAELQARERREELSEILERIGQQTNTVIENALALANEHRTDADIARGLAAQTATAHAECRQEVATLGGKVEELRARMTETERTAGLASRVSEHHQRIKHKALNLPPERSARLSDVRP